MSRAYILLSVNLSRKGALFASRSDLVVEPLHLCLGRMILFGERSLRRVLNEYMAHYHTERNHQGLGNHLLDPFYAAGTTDDPIQHRERLGGILNFYYREAA